MLQGGTPHAYLWRASSSSALLHVSVTVVTARLTAWVRTGYSVAVGGVSTIVCRASSFRWRTIGGSVTASMSKPISWLTPAAPKLTAGRRNGQKWREILAKSAKISPVLGQRERRGGYRLLRRFCSRSAASTLQLHRRHDKGCIVPGDAADVLLEGVYRGLKKSQCVAY